MIINIYAVKEAFAFVPPLKCGEHIEKCCPYYVVEVVKIFKTFQRY